MKKSLLLIISLLCLFALSFAANFKLQPGDLLFQDLNCGTLCNGINKVTYGIGDTEISHVGMVESVSGKQPIIIEAISKGVVETPLNEFLARSYDKDGNPMTIVGRLNPPYRILIPKALVFAKKQLGKPYNFTFAQTHKSFYCSQLIDYAFKKSNSGKVIFNQNPMNFNDPKTGKITQAWSNYFTNLDASVPQGDLGTNPGELSREKDKITIVHAYGKLRKV